MSPIYPPGEHNERLMRLRGWLETMTPDELAAAERHLSPHTLPVLIAQQRLHSAARDMAEAMNGVTARTVVVCKEFIDSAIAFKNAHGTWRTAKSPSVQDIDTSDCTPDETTGEWAAVRAEGSVG